LTDFFFSENKRRTHGRDPGGIAQGIGGRQEEGEFMPDQDLYTQLAHAIGAKDSKLIPRLFQRICNFDEARLLLAASPPKTSEQLASEIGLPKEKIESMLSSLFVRGVMFKSTRPDGILYYRVRNIMQFHDATILWKDAPRDFLDLWKEHTQEELPGYWVSVKNAMGRAPARVIPIGRTLAAQNQILAYEDVRALIEGAGSLAVTNCTCRVIDGKCGKPVEVCMQLGKAADYAIERGTGKGLTVEQALAVMKTAERAGLVHIVMNSSTGIHTICNCCSDCCWNWSTAAAKSLKVAAPSRFLAAVSDKLCTACGTCLEVCPFEAIVFAGDDQGRVKVSQDACMGCGVCAELCPEDAISLQEVRRPEFIPA
jgi:Pyruvate/2-oxoacid:ferredoxin oxidoreductase delta subunit